MCALLANGRIRLACSAGFEGHDLTQKVREQFIAAAGIKRDSDRLEASFEQRAVRGAARRQPGARGRRLTACIGKVPPSKVLRKLGREAFAKHVKPKLMGGVKVCQYRDRNACRVVGGASTCSAGGHCKEARRLLPFWPKWLACVSPLQHTMISEWNLKFLKALQEAGLDVSLPDQATAQRAPEEVRRPALRGTAPVTPSAPTEEVSGAAAQLLGVDLDQARSSQPAPKELREPAAAAAAAAGPQSGANQGSAAGLEAGNASAANLRRPGGRALPRNPNADTPVMQEGLRLIFGDENGDKALRSQMSLWLTSARSQLRAPVLVDQTMFTFQTHAQLNAAHLPLLNLLKDKPVLFDEDARLIIAKLQARCCKAAAAAGRSAADGGALPDEDAPPDEGAAPDEGLPQLVAPQNDGNANAGGDGAPRVPKRQRLPSRRQAAASEAVASPSRASKRQRRRREQGNGTPPRVRLVAADTATMEERPQALAGGTARSRRPAQQPAGHCTWIPDLHLGATDRKYPVSEHIAAMLPEDAAMRASVLANPVAAKAIMCITDTAVYSASLSGHSAASKHMCARVIMDGAPTLLARVPEDALRGWLLDRGFLPPPQRKGNSERSNRCQLKLLELLEEYKADKEAVKHAVRWLRRIVDEHAAAR